jgi:hypothetical protein
VSVTVTSSLPSFTGGVVQSGTYVLQSEQVYISGFPGGISQVVGMVQDTIQITGTTIQRATNSSSTAEGASLLPAGTFTATFSTFGTTYRATESCPSTGVLSGGYSAGPTTLTLESKLTTDAGISGFVIANYTLQAGG